MVFVTAPAIAPLKKDSTRFLGWLSSETLMLVREFELCFDDYILVMLIFQQIL